MRRAWNPRPGSAKVKNVEAVSQKRIGSARKKVQQMKNTLLQKTFCGFAAALSLGITAPHPAAAQCVSGLGAPPAQIAAQNFGAVTAYDFTSLSVYNGTGIGENLTFVKPARLAVDNKGMAYLLDAGHNRDVFQLIPNGASGLQAIQSPGQLPGPGIDIRYGGGFVWALTSNGHLTTPFLPSSSPSYTDLAVSGNALAGLTFDGQHLWVSDGGSLYKALPPTSTAPGSVTKHLTLKTNGPISSLAFDGRYVWVAAGNQLIKVEPSTGVQLAATTLPGTITSVTFDGVYFWIGAGPTGGVTKFDPVTSQFIIQYTSNVTDGQSVAFDGSRVWMTNSPAGSVTTLRACDGASITAPSVVTGPMSLAYDGFEIWILYQNSNTVSVR
jgi:hypothetical protein